jgi:hypothetical protein
LQDQESRRKLGGIDADTLVQIAFSTVATSYPQRQPTEIAMPKFVSILLVALIVAPLLASPALAKKNNGGGIKKTGSGELSHESACSLFYGLMRAAEIEADKRAGTAAAAPFSAEADHWWSAGVSHGCSWAA